ncbi:acyl carrier protein [Sulfuricurvum sp.]|uniref:acyl carrier protein n=1 Tax=Sulfuricurvum sp. TaxID=2025608 RepID=UPI003BAEBD1B
MTKDQIKAAIVEQILFIAPDVDEADIIPDKNIQRSLEIDSFDFLKILTALNEVTGVEVPEADYAKVDTLEHMVEYFSRSLNS